MLCSSYLKLNNKYYYGVGTVTNDNQCRRLSDSGSQHRWDSTTHCCYVPKDLNNSFGVYPQDLGLNYYEYNFLFSLTALLVGFLIMRTFK